VRSLFIFLDEVTVYGFGSSASLHIMLFSKVASSPAVQTSVTINIAAPWSAGGAASVTAKVYQYSQTQPTISQVF
jgi:hypothetical protein